MTRQRTQADVLADLGPIGEQIAAHEKALTELYPQRLALFQEGRAMDPPIVNRVMGEAAGCEENAVLAALRRADKKAKAQAGT